MAKIGSFLAGQGKGLSLLFTMLIGALIPQGHVLSDWIQYLLMVMLFFAFLDIEFKFRKSVLWVLLANVAVAFVVYMVLVPFNLMLALAGFMTAIAPTAIAAPVIISFIQREVEYVVASVMLTNIASAFVVPIALPFLIGTTIQISIWEVLQPVSGRDVRAVDPCATCKTASRKCTRFYSQRESDFVSSLVGQPVHYQCQGV